jgi:trans-aconitate methyltransferase
MAHPMFRLAARVLNWPLRVLVRPYPRLNAMVWDLQYTLGLWRYLDHGQDPAPLEFARRVNARPRVLDLGCGTTVNLALPTDGYRHYHGVDISRAAIRRARSLRRPHTSFEVAELLSYHTAERYDVVLLREVLYYFSLDEAVGLLHRAAGFLAPGGRLIVWLYDVETPTTAGLLRAVRDCGLAVHDELPAGSGGTGIVLMLGSQPANADAPGTP